MALEEQLDWMAQQQAIAFLLTNLIAKDIVESGAPDRAAAGWRGLAETARDAVTPHPDPALSDLMGQMVHESALRIVARAAAMARLSAGE